MTNFWLIFTGFGYFLAIATVPFILLSKKSPHSMLAWLWGVFLFPFFGPLAYFFWGSERVYRRRLLRRSHIGTRRNKIQFLGFPENFSESEKALGKLLSEINIFPSSRYTNIQLLLDASTFYPALEKSIEEARDSIWIEFYIWKNDRWGNHFLHLLIKAAQRGVKVSVILDEMGCLGLSQNFFEPLKQEGGQFTWFNSIQLIRRRWTFALRNHRKLQIIDGTTGFIGGMNIGREYMGEDKECGTWRDLQIKIEGPVIHSLKETFMEDWHFATGETLTSGIEKETSLPPPDTDWVQVVENGPDSSRRHLSLTTMALLDYAQKRVWIAAGYFLPHEPLTSALKLCAARGVDVRILVAGNSDHPYLVISARSYYEELLDYGIKIYEYSQGTHHAKALLIDDEICSIGSANMDVRSMKLNFELNLVFRSKRCADELSRILTADFETSEKIQLSNFMKRGIYERSKENVLRLIAPLL